MTCLRLNRASFSAFHWQSLISRSLPTSRQNLRSVLGVADEQVILDAAEHLGAAGVALAGGAAEKLAVDAAGAVRLGGDHVQPADVGHARASLMSVPRPAMFVATVICPLLAGLGDDLGLRPWSAWR